MKKLLLFAMAIIFAMQLSAQTMVVVGDTTTTTISSYVPMYMNYENSFAESLYPATELLPGTISSISYYVSENAYSNGTMTIYMKEVTNASLESFVVGSDFTQVYSGPANFVPGCNTFALTTPFNYTGIGNLLVAVIRDGTSYSTPPYFRHVPISSSVYYYSDYSEYSITSQPDATYNGSTIPVTKFEIEVPEGFCFSPASVTYDIESLTTEEVTINWTLLDESSTTFGLAYKATGEEEWTVVSENITDLSYTLTGLEPYTEYQVKVYTVCEGGNSFDRMTSFITLPSEDNFIVLPYTETFDDLDNISAWALTNPNTNKWYIGALGHNSTSEDAEAEGNGLYISNDEGVSNAYANNQTSTAHASVLINIEESTLYGIAFDYKNNAESCCDKVYLSLIPFIAGLGEEINDDYVIAEFPNTSNQWQRQTLDFPSTIAPGQYYLALSWHNDSSMGDNPPAAIDNISIYTSSCTSLSLTPSVEVADTEEGTFNLVVSLVDDVNVDVTYALQYRAANQEEWIEVTDLTIEEFPYYITEDIEPLTNYEIKVGVLCSDAEEVVYINPITILTPCQAETTPWFENFDQDPVLAPSCWNRYSSYLPTSGQITSDQLTTTSGYWYYAENFPVGEITSSVYRMNLYSNSTRGWLVTPSINLPEDEEVKQLAFSVGLRKYGDNVAPQSAPDDRFIVMVSLDNGATWDIANGIVFADGDADTEHNMSDLALQMTRYSYKLVNADDEPLTGTVRFAFYGESTVSNGDNYLAIDDIAVENWSECPAPYALSVDPVSITPTSATVSFLSWGPATTWEYALVEGADADPNTASAEEISSTGAIELTELSPETTYTFAVRAICEDGESDWTTITFTTLASSEEIPYETSFDEGMWSVDNGSNTSNAWVVGEGTGNEAPAAYISNDGSAYAASQTSTTTISHIWKDFDFGQTEDDFELSFDWKVTGYQEGSSVTGGIAAYLVDPSPLPASGLLNENNIVAIVTGSDEWQTERIFLGNVTGEKRLVFTALGYRSVEELAVPAAIDNVSLVVSPCSQVQDVVLSNSTITTIDVAWTLTEADNYTISYRAAGSEEIQTETVTESPFTLTDLTPSTQYYVSVTAVCGSDEAIPSSTVIAYTLQEPTEIPYTCNFDEEGDNGWLLKNGSCVNKWYIGTPADSTNGKLYISNNNGTSASYTTGTPSVVVAEKLFQLGATDSVRISFDLTIRGESSFDYLKVYWVPADTIYEASDNEDVYYGKSTYANGVIMDNYADTYYTFVNLVEGTQNMSVTLSNNPNELRKLVFVWKNDSGSGSQPPATIDNIMIEEVGEEITCFKPVDNSLTATDLTQTSAVISWLTVDDTQSAWNVYYKAESDTEYEMVTASETSIELSDLTPNTQYTVYVKTDCGGEESAESTTLTFRTECIALTAPLTEDFTTNVITNPCWQVATGLLSNNTTLTYGTAAWVHSTNTIEGNSTGKLRLNLYDVKKEWVISPQIDLGEDETLYEVSAKVAFSAWGDPTMAPSIATDDKFAIVVSTDGGATWSNANAIIFAEGDSDTEHDLSDLTTSFTRVRFLLQDAEGNPLTGLIKVGFYAESTEWNADNDLYIEDFMINEPSSCAEPVSNSVVVSNITETSATVSWTDNDESHSAWNVYYKALNEEEYSMITASETTIELPALELSTTYLVYVTANCGDEESLPTSTVSFNTPCGIIASFPYVEGFEGTDLGCWSAETITGYSMYPYPWVLLTATDLDDVFIPIGEQSIWHTYEQGVSGRLISPIFDLTALDNPYLKFNYQRLSDFGAVEGLTVKYRTNSDESWIELMTMNGEIDQWVLDSIALPNASETYQIAFESMGVYGYGVVIDAFTIYDAEGEQGGTDPEPCDAPTNLSASNITETTAEITWNGTASNYEFRVNSGEAETLTTTTKSLTGLTPNTAYTVEVRSICGEETSTWTSTNFTTLAEQGGEVVAPVVVTTAATGVDHQSAILNGTITVGTETITAQGFKYKAQSATTWSEVSATGTTISAVVNGLTEQTTYIFKAYATTASGTVEGNEMTFTTTAAPVVVVEGEVTTTPATEVGNTSATLNGALVSAGNSENFTVGFALATVADFTLEDAGVQNVVATLADATFSQSVTDLVEGQTYFFRAYITNEAGTTYGAVETFTLSGLADAMANAITATIYPNPAQEIATMEIAGLDQDAKIVISDLQGRILSQDAISAGETRYTINVSNLASGVYYIRIVTDKAVSTQKLIVE